MRIEKSPLMPGTRWSSGCAAPPWGLGAAARERFPVIGRACLRTRRVRPFSAECQPDWADSSGQGPELVHRASHLPEGEVSGPAIFKLWRTFCWSQSSITYHDLPDSVIPSEA